MSKLKFVKNSIYKLKQLYGMPVAYHIIDQHSVDAPSGDKTTVLSVIHIRKAIILRAREFRSFVYDLAYISANKDFTSGGFFDPEDRRLIFDAKDLKGHNPQIWDYVIFQNERYDIKEVHDYENNFAFGCLARKVRGQKVTRMVTQHSGIIFTQEISVVKIGKLERSPKSVLVLTQTLQETV